MKKIITIIISCVLICALCVFGGFYVSAYFAISGIENAANVSVTEETDIPETAISEEDMEKLRHVDDEKLTLLDYYLDGGVSLPIIYPSEGKFKMHYTYEYKVVDPSKNELLQKKNGTVMTVEIDFVEGEWVVCGVGQEKAYAEFLLDMLFGEKEEADTPTPAYLAKCRYDCCI